MKNIFLGALMVLLFASFASAEPKAKVFTLKDGTVIQGVLAAIENGDYIVESPALGKLRLKEGDVQSVNAAGYVPAPASAAASAPSNGEMDAIQSQLMSDPAMMADLQAIASDPEVMALVSDPAFMAAAQSKDANAIKLNPRTAQLMQNPKVRALIEKIQATHGVK